MTTPKIACPFCGHLYSTVTDVRPARREGVSVRGDGVWRRRQCLACHRRFTTTEVLIGKYLLVSSTHHNI